MIDLMIHFAPELIAAMMAGTIGAGFLIVRSA